jgi:hypothetical protein
MSDLQYFEYPPPRSWEQFEELCADLFEAMWNDPGLVRHGRAGQKQHGVDIVARRGSQYPIGLQCKKKAKWPIRKLTTVEIDAEVEDAQNFTPPLQAFYLLTTAEDDTKLQEHVRGINERLSKAGLFETVLLGWQEIARRVTRYEQVAKKHFPGFGSAELVSPLLATWYTSRGKLELTGEEWNLAVGEAAEDFFDWPGGHIVVRQRETDTLSQELQELVGAQRSTALRSRTLKLRQKFRRMLVAERQVEATIKLILSYEKFRSYFLTLWGEHDDLPIVIRSIIEDYLDPELGPAHDLKIRVHPPSPHLLSGHRSQYSVADMEIPVYLPEDLYIEMMQLQDSNSKRYGNPAMNTVDELPASVRTQYVVPAIIRRIQRIRGEEKKTVLEMDSAGYLDVGMWTVTY